MKKTLLLAVMVISILACKKEAKKESVANEASKSVPLETKTGVQSLKGEFIYYSDAAVLQTPSEVYGVIIDSMMHVLNDKVKAYKNEDTDMVPVSVKGEVSEKDPTEEGWPYRLKVLEVIQVFEPNPENNDVIKIEKQSQ
ncbi:MAG: hypothetical protein KJP09_09645 [Bacteroidia bacterium]|nr:hypothetical protein [Bacteroidia bacterium]NND11738.1 hypothetical protein [Flavobacteriaceae bacterium]MBT8309428.1 hypothetical protein [Bacteroidia bacterium]NNK28576.1 hypothetical protein [Flavobacteriaceae bacterium]NNL61617.1 hypothetical protein [Flavobacteriaceae bacterium]